MCIDTFDILFPFPFFIKHFVKRVKENIRCWNTNAKVKEWHNSVDVWLGNIIHDPKWQALCLFFTCGRQTIEIFTRNLGNNVYYMYNDVSHLTWPFRSQF